MKSTYTALVLFLICILNSCSNLNDENIIVLLKSKQVLETSNTHYKKNTSELIERLRKGIQDAQTSSKSSIWHAKAIFVQQKLDSILSEISEIKTKLSQTADYHSVNDSIDFIYFKNNKINLTQEKAIKTEAEKVYSKFQVVIKSIEIELPKGLEDYPYLHESILQESKSLTTNHNLCKSDFELEANNISLLYNLTRILCLENKILAFKNKAIEFCEDQALGRIVEDYYSYNAIITITSERLIPNEKFEIYAGIGCFEKKEITGCSVFKKPVPIENGVATYKGRASSVVGEKTIPVEIYRKNHKGEIDTLRKNVIYHVVDTICSH